MARVLHGRLFALAGQTKALNVDVGGNMNARGAGAVLDQYLADVDSHLTGPKRWRRDLLAELRDGLVDATEHHRQRGDTSLKAAALAVGESGPAHLVAAAYTPVLQARLARRTGAALLLSGPVIGLTWLLTLAPGQTPDALLTRYPVLAPLVIIAVAAGMLTMAATGRLQRWLPRPAHLAHVAAGTACVAATVCDIALLAIVAMVVLSGTIDHHVALAVATCASCSRLVLSQRAARQHVALARSG